MLLNLVTSEWFLFGFVESVTEGSIFLLVLGVLCNRILTC